MIVLVLNAGSSSLKYQLIDMESNHVLAKGLCERIGGDSRHKHGIDKDEKVITVPMKNHADALDEVFKTLVDPSEHALSDMSQIDAVGHRVVSGGDVFTESVIVDDKVYKQIEDLVPLAPLHNPPALHAMKACMEKMPGVPQVAVFDTSFFTTIPPKAYMYPIPIEYYEKYHIRKYGAHGTSHRYVAMRAAELMGRPLSELKLITCHLGNGSSVTAIDHGVAADTSMGFTPLDGVMMGTRSGSIDPAIVTFIMKHENLTPDEMDDILNRHSGLLAISGISNDLREVKAATLAGDERASLAYDMYSNSVKKYIGQYIATMAGVDGIVFTAGIGEHCERMRRMILAGLEPLGIIMDYEKNRLHGSERDISDGRSKVRIIIIPTSEEYMIAQDVVELTAPHHEYSPEGFNDFDTFDDEYERNDSSLTA